MDLIWIITKTDPEYNFSILEDHPVTATVEDAHAAFTDAVRQLPGASADYTIPLDRIPTEPDRSVSWSRDERTSPGEIVLTCRQVASGLRTAALKARRAELEQELAQIKQQLADSNTEAEQIDEELEALWNA